VVLIPTRVGFAVRRTTKCESSGERFAFASRTAHATARAAFLETRSRNISAGDDESANSVIVARGQAQKSIACLRGSPRTGFATVAAGQDRILPGRWSHRRFRRRRSKHSLWRPCRGSAPAECRELRSALDILQVEPKAQKRRRNARTAAGRRNSHLAGS